ARVEDARGRDRDERGGGERADRADVPAQCEHEPHRRDAEPGGDESYGESVQAEEADYGERQVVERRAVVVARVVAVDALLQKVRQEEAVDALVVVQRLQVERVDAKRRRNHQYDDARDEPRALRYLGAYRARRRQRVLARRRARRTLPSRATSSLRRLP